MISGEQVSRNLVERRHCVPRGRWIGFAVLGNSHLNRVRQTFADQFATDPLGCVYRKGQKGPPFRVSELERDEFIAKFNKRIRYAIWSIFPATVALILVLVWLTPNSDSPVADLAIWAGIGAILLPFMVIFYWAWNSPSHELRSRKPEGAALTKEEAHELAFSKITYGQLALAAAMGAGLVWKMSLERAVLHGWGLIWLIFGGGSIAVAALQAIRKFCFNMSRPNDRA